MKKLLKVIPFTYFKLLKWLLLKSIPTNILYALLMFVVFITILKKVLLYIQMFSAGNSKKSKCNLEHRVVKKNHINDSTNYSWVRSWIYGLATLKKHWTRWGKAQEARSSFALHVAYLLRVQLTDWFRTWEVQEKRQITAFGTSTQNSVLGEN
jgi:hypothetical protein